jgi:hypothetical protein
LPGASRCVDDFPKRRRAGAGDPGRLDRNRTVKGRAGSVLLAYCGKMSGGAEGYLAFRF